jgi:hypothetical protein
MFHENFWEFSKKVCKGNLDKPSPKPTFDKKTADDYYPKMYSQPPPFDTTSLNWFPFLQVPPTPVTFNLSHIKPIYYHRRNPPPLLGRMV